MSENTTVLESPEASHLRNAKRDASGQIAWLFERFTIQEPQHSLDADRLTVAVISDSKIVEYGVMLMLSSNNRRIHIITPSQMEGGHFAVDVTLINVGLNTRAGIEAIDAAVQDPASGAVVALTARMYAVLVRRVLERGCKGCLDLALDAEDLMAALEQVGRGGIVISPGGQNEIDVFNHTIDAGPWRGHADGLSRREGEIISLIGQGLRNHEIAAGLFLSINSVKSYVRSSYRKIGVESRSEAVRWGMEHGMLLDQSSDDFLSGDQARSARR